RVRESVRWQITIAPTIAPTRVVRLRHHGRCSRMMPGVAAIVEAAATVLVALARDRLKDGCLVHDTDDPAILHRAARAIARSDHGHRASNRCRHIEPRPVLLARPPLAHDPAEGEYVATRDDAYEGRDVLGGR